MSHCTVVFFCNQSHKIHSIPQVFTGSFAVDFGDHLRLRIICGPFWGSFAVSGSFAAWDHLRYCTVHQLNHVTTYPAPTCVLPVNTMRKSHSHTLLGTDTTIHNHSRLRAVPFQSVESKLGRTGESEMAESESGKKRGCILFCNRRVQTSPRPQHWRIGLVDKQ